MYGVFTYRIRKWIMWTNSKVAALLFRGGLALSYCRKGIVGSNTKVAALVGR
jgi:hypothetical protein